MTREQIDNLADVVGTFNVLEPRDALDEALVALAFDPETQKPQAVYDIKAAALIVAKLDGMEYEDAWEWLSYNASGTVVWLHELERVLES